MELVLVFIALMVLAVIYAFAVEQRPPTFQEQMVEIGAVFNELGRLISDELTPAFNAAAAAWREYEEAMIQRLTNDD